MAAKLKNALSKANKLTEGYKLEIGGGAAGLGAGTMVGGVGVAGAFGAFGVPAVVVVGVTALAGVGAVYAAKKVVRKLRD
ncbi:hypothetical protein QM996_13955 [Sinorhizobium chiapasense]